MGPSRPYQKNDSRHQKSERFYDFIRLFADFIEASGRGFATFCRVLFWFGSARPSASPHLTKIKPCNKWLSRGLRPHLTKIKPWPGQMPCLGKHNIPKVAPLTKKQISLDKLLEHTSECQSLDKIRAKPDKGIKPLPFLMSTVAFFMRATRTQSDILLSFLLKFFFKKMLFFFTNLDFLMK